MQRGSRDLSLKLSNAYKIIEDVVENDRNIDGDVYKSCAIKQIVCEGVAVLLSMSIEEINEDCLLKTGKRYDKLWIQYNQLLIAHTQSELLLGVKNPSDSKFMYRRLLGENSI